MVAVCAASCEASELQWLPSHLFADTWYGVVRSVKSYHLESGRSNLFFALQDADVRSQL